MATIKIDKDIDLLVAAGLTGVCTDAQLTVFRAFGKIGFLLYKHNNSFYQLRDTYRIL